MAEELAVPQTAETETPPVPGTETTSATAEKQGDAATPPADATSEEQQPKKKGGGFQKRIDKLTRQVYELSAQLESARVPVGDSRQDEKEPSREEFDDLETYNRALATHMAKQVYREERQKDEHAQASMAWAKEQAKRNETWESRVESASEKYDDGDDVIAHFATTVKLPAITLDAIIESELGGDIAYYLGKNEQELDRISKLSMARQAIEIGKLEVKLAANPVKKPSSAPPPVNPVSGNRAGGNNMPQDSDDTETWMKKERARLRAMRQ